MFDTRQRLSGTDLDYYSLDRLRDAGLPFGRGYLVAFGAKMAFALALFIGTGLLAVRLRFAASWHVPSIAGARGRSVELIRAQAPFFAVRRDACLALAVTNLITGGALLVTAVVAGYLHLLVHAGTFLSR